MGPAAEATLRQRWPRSSSAAGGARSGVLGHDLCWFLGGVWREPFTRTAPPAGGIGRRVGAGVTGAQAGGRRRKDGARGPFLRLLLRCIAELGARRVAGARGGRRRTRHSQWHDGGQQTEPRHAMWRSRCRGEAAGRPRWFGGRWRAAWRRPSSRNAWEDIWARLPAAWKLWMSCWVRPHAPRCSLSVTGSRQVVGCTGVDC
jgi:hypothetical protein